MPSGALVLLILRVLRSGPLRLHDRSTNPYAVIRCASGRGFAIRRSRRSWSRAGSLPLEASKQAAGTVLQADERWCEAARSRGIPIRPADQSHPGHSANGVASKERTFVRELLRRIHYLLHRGRFDDELKAEMAAHREMAEKSGGVRLGNELQLREESREAWGFMWLDRLGQDLRYAFRAMRSSPGFTTAGARARYRDWRSRRSLRSAWWLCVRCRRRNDPAVRARARSIGVRYSVSGRAFYRENAPCGCPRADGIRSEPRRRRSARRRVLRDHNFFD